jgi:REP element-mobilizing transposase RayT
MILHAAHRAAEGRRALIGSWREARELWRRVTGAVRVHALVLMLDHLHALFEDSQLNAYRSALRGFALWLNRARGTSGAVFEHHARPVPVRAGNHLRRTVRYVLLNPCRAGLVGDPLAWAFSTHSDAVGLAWPACRRADRDPDGFHAWVSSDSAVAVGGTLLPRGTRRAGRSGVLQPAELVEIAAAVSAITRTPTEHLQRRGPARSLLLQSARVLSTATLREIAEFAGVHRMTVMRVPTTRDRRIALIERVLGDPRFCALDADAFRRVQRLHRSKASLARM